VISPELSKWRFHHWPAIPFFYASAVVMYFLASHFYDPGQRRFEFTQPEIFGGDEPHYLIMISSISQGGGMSLGERYRSVRLGSLDAGRSRMGLNLDHHTLIQDVATGESHLWEQVFSMFTPMECPRNDPFCVGYARISEVFPGYTPVSPEYRELPKHPVPFPGLLGTLLRVWATRDSQLETRAIYIQVFLSWLAGIVTYLCGRRAGLTPVASVLATALVYYASPWLEYSHQLFPATFMGLLLITALWAFLSKRIWLSAPLLAVAAMQSEAFVLVFVGWTLMLYFLNEKRAALMFAAAGGISLIATASLSHWLIGKASIRDMTFVLDPVLLWRTFIEPETGVLMFIPWSIAVFVFLALSFFLRKPEIRPVTGVLRMLAAGIAPVAAVYMILPYTGQYCYGPRYWIPFVPWLALALILGLKMLGLNLSDYKKYVRGIVMAVMVLVCISAGVSALMSIAAAAMAPSETWHQPPWHALVGLFHA